jgi:uncharacterized membrane protein
MAALAYALLPLSGLIAYSMGTSERVRFHGLQAIVVGLAWPLLLYAASALAPIATQIVFALGCLVWLWLFVASAIGRDPALPFLGRRLARATGADPLPGSETHTA